MIYILPRRTFYSFMMEISNSLDLECPWRWLHPSLAVLGAIKWMHNKIANSLQSGLFPDKGYLLYKKLCSMWRVCSRLPTDERKYSCFLTIFNKLEVSTLHTALMSHLTQWSTEMWWDNDVVRVNGYEYWNCYVYRKYQVFHKLDDGIWII